MKRNFFLIALAFGIATSAPAWDDGGHFLLNEIAARKLRPEVAKQAETLLPLLDTQLNGGRPYNLVTAGAWLDDMRGLGKTNPWKVWHYIDVPCVGDTFVEPSPPHALWALDQATATLRSKTAEPKARAEALALVMHIVGDIHQPMHVADHHDAGGNGVRLAPMFASDEGPKNLHAFWDAAYRYDAKEGQMTELWPRSNRISRPQTVNEPGLIAEQATLLLANAPKSAPVPISKDPWREWARETHAMACKSGWPEEIPADKNSAVQLTPEFVHKAHQIATQQIEKAGERLGALLNEMMREEKHSTAQGRQDHREPVAFQPKG